MTGFNSEFFVYAQMWRELENFLHSVVREDLPEADDAKAFLQLMRSVKRKYSHV